MRKLILGILFSCLFSFLSAQKISDEIVYLHTISQASKRQLVKDYLNIEDHEAPGFWHLYDQYELERKIIEQEQMVLLKKLTDEYATLTPAEANKIARRLFVFNLYSERINKKYYNKFSKAISPVKAVQFLHLESYIQNSVQSYLQDSFFINQLQGIESARNNNSTRGSD